MYDCLFHRKTEVSQVMLCHYMTLYMSQVTNFSFNIQHERF